LQSDNPEKAERTAWVEKYRPKKLNEVVSNKENLEKILKWIVEFKEGKAEKKALLFYGPPGSGKTSVAIAVARELGYDYTETNASDSRTKGIVERVIGRSATAGSLYPEEEGKIIIVDEVDGIHGKYDHGGLSAIVHAIKNARQPLILTANDIYSLSREFRELCEVIQFRRVDKRNVLHVLKSIAAKEKIEAEENALKIIADNSNGDLRAAINDLQAIGEGGSIDVASTDVIGMRDTEVSIFNVIAKIFKANKCSRAREAFQEASEDPELVSAWIVENLPIEYTDVEEIAFAYNYASRSDVFFGRIRRRQDFGLMRYGIDLLVCGVAAAKKKEKRGFTRYQFPESLKMLSRTKAERALLDSISEKVGRYCHVSKRDVRRYFIPMLKVLFKNPQHAGRLAHDFKFELNEIKFFSPSPGEAEEIGQISEKIKKEKLIKTPSRQTSLF